MQKAIVQPYMKLSSIMHKFIIHSLVSIHSHVELPSIYAWRHLSIIYEAARVNALTAASAAADACASSCCVYTSFTSNLLEQQHKPMDLHYSTMGRIDQRDVRQSAPAFLSPSGRFSAPVIKGKRLRRNVIWEKWSERWLSIEGSCHGDYSSPWFIYIYIIYKYIFIYIY